MARGSKSKDLSLAQALGQFLERTLIPDLRARVEESPSVKRALDDALARERAAGRTADDPIAYRERTLEQVGAAWLLACVFVRFLEDRGFVSHRRLAGDGAVDAQERFGAAFPGLAGNAREYLLAVFREAGNFPGARELLGARHDVARRLGPSAGVAGDMLRLFREELADKSLRWRFDSDDTRVLGDLYQHLSIAVQERYALKQTPDFVESFILDHTLDPAVKEFGLDGFRVIDPTCGSGHFLLGAFHRLRALHQRNDPSSDAKQHAHDALRHVFGVDLNPFAVAISRFRLLVAYLGAAGIRRLRDAPADLDLDGHIVVADSLLYGGKNPSLADGLSDNAARRSFGGEHFVLEDPIAGRAVFGHGYHAVVGNPPYIVCRDASLRELYRSRYPDSAQRQFALAAPFTERFFELGVDGGFVGLINSNSFMKREFGRGLIEKVLPRLDLTAVVDTSGAFIPGHDTPTVILFGRNQNRKTDTVRAVLGRRGEPGTPEDPSKGKVWVSITDHISDVIFENDFVTVTSLSRGTLTKHPWSLGGGGASELKKFIENRCTKQLQDVVDEIGTGAVTREDEVYLVGAGAAQRMGVRAEQQRVVAEGEFIRDWCISDPTVAIWPYDPSTLSPTDPDDRPEILRALWCWRTQLSQRVAFGKSQLARGLRWYEFSMFFRERFRTPLTIAFACISTHNHFVLDRGGNVFKQSAPIIKLPAMATEEDHIALLAWLNSSAVCFWIKTVCYPKSTPNKDINLDRGDPSTNRYDIAGTAIEPMPIPEAVMHGPMHTELIRLTRRVEDIAITRANSAPSVILAHWIGNSSSALRAAFDVAEVTANRCLRALVVLQEDLDWHFYAELSLCGPVGTVEGGADPDQRPFLWSNGSPPDSLESALREEWTRRRRMIEESSELRLLEDPMYKRPWEGRRGIFGHGVRTWEERVIDACEQWLLDEVERIVGGSESPISMREIAMQLLRAPKASAVIELLHAKHGDNVAVMLSTLADADAVHFLAPGRFTDSGLEKRARWEHTWDLQRREDAGDSVGDIPVPPKYDHEDYREPRYWSLRGKLDVPRERFIAYPGATTDDAPSPLYGWAGWDHRQRAEALTALYLRRKDEDGWTAERLLSLLAGLDELVPWLKQWHNAPQPGEDLGAGDAYDAFLTTELHALGLTRARLRGWRPPEKRAGRAAAKAKAAATVAATDEAAGEAPVAKKRGRPKKSATPDTEA